MKNRTEVTGINSWGETKRATDLIDYIYHKITKLQYEFECEQDKLLKACTEKQIYVVKVGNIADGINNITRQKTALIQDFWDNVEDCLEQVLDARKFKLENVFPTCRYDRENFIKYTVKGTIREILYRKGVITEKEKHL